MNRENADVPRIDTPTTRLRAIDSGTLILLGGNLNPEGPALDSFLSASGAYDGAPIVVLTLASGAPVEAEAYWRHAFATRGIKRVMFPRFNRDDESLDAELASLIDQAGGVFLTGGNQVTLVTALSGTRACAALKDLYSTGGVVGGTSAGAAALTELTMAGGEVDSEGNLVEQYIGPGLGLLGHDAIVDTHFSERRRLKRLFFVVASNTQLFGIGIDEDTGLVVRNDIGEVVGAGGVTFVDGRHTVRFDNAHELEAGRQLTLSHLRVGIVGTRYRLNLVERDLHELLLVRDPAPAET